MSAAPQSDIDLIVAFIADELKVRQASFLPILPGEDDHAAIIAEAEAALEAAKRLREQLVRIVIAARGVAFDDHSGPDALRELDGASEAFATLVAWER